MSNGITAMWDDADEYKTLAKYYKEEIRITPGGMWPYHMDDKHFYELRDRYRKEKK